MGLKVAVNRMNKPYTPWRVRWRVPGSPRPERRFFKTRAAAVEKRDAVLAQFAQHGAAAFALTPHAAAEWRDAREILPADVSLVDAARFYLKHRGAAPVARGPTVRVAWVAFCASRAGRSHHYQVQLAGQCEPLLEVVGWDQRLAMVQTEALEAAITAGGGAEETKANRRRMLATFFRWSVQRHSLGVDPMAMVRRWPVTRGSPRFYTPAQLRRLLEALAERAPHLIGAVALRAWAGLREIEVRRMVRGHYLEADLRPKTRAILVRAEVAKATGPEGRGRPRLIEGLPANLWAWLKVSPPVWWSMKSIASLRPCFALANVAPIKNGLRHSFVTYAAAWYESLEKAAMVAGHDTEVMRAHYLGLATKKQAQEWFAIDPAGW